MATRYNPEFTRTVVETTGPKASPRTKQVFSALFKHVHDFAREVDLTIEEWQMGMQFLDEVGHMYFTSNKTRHEMHRISDIIGLESLVDEIAHKHMSESGEEPTSSSILGPFWSPDAPFRELGGSIIQDPHKGHATLMHGTVYDLDTKKPIPHAVVDIWQASSNGKYDFQDPDNQSPNNLRGKFRTDSEGKYHFYGLKPTAYSLPQDGPSWQLLQLLDRHPMRPAHIHIMVTADNYKSVVTQIFPKDDPWLETDTVFAVKDDLVVDFTPLEGDPNATLEMKYDYVLAPKAPSGATNGTTNGATNGATNGVSSS